MSLLKRLEEELKCGENAIRFLESYKDKPEMRDRIAWEMIDIFQYTKSCKVLDIISDILTKYRDTPTFAEVIIKRLNDIAWYERQEKILKFVSEIYLNDYVKDAIMNYRKYSDIGERALWEIGSITWYTRSYEPAILLSQVLTDYKERPEKVKEILIKASDIAWETRNAEAVKNFLQKIEKKS